MKKTNQGASFRRRALYMAMGAALTSMSSLPVVAYGVGGNFYIEQEGDDPISIEDSTFSNSDTIYQLNLYGEGVMESVTNSGTIENPESAINMGSDFDVETLTNTSSGVIRASNNDFDIEGDGPARAIWDLGDLGGALVNEGTIEAIIAVEDEDYAEAATFKYDAATAIDVGNLTGTINNNGTINAKASAVAGGESVDEAFAEARKVKAIREGRSERPETISGTLTNSSTIMASVEAMATAMYTATAKASDVYGIDSSGLTGALTNDGTIKATASAKADAGEWESADGYGAYGIRLGNGIYDEGSLINNNTIEATVSATAVQTGEAEARRVRGIDAGSGIAFGSSLTNNEGGSITATASASAGEYATAMDVIGVFAGWEGINGTLENKGSITAAATATADYASAGFQTSYYFYEYTNRYPIVGILSSGIYGTLSNSGSISATATATGMYEAAAKYVYGIDDASERTLEGTLDNSGSISATASASAEEGEASAGYVGGIQTSSIAKDAELINQASGSITASAEATGEFAAAKYVTGVDVDGGIYGTLDNRGSITATATATGDYAVVGYGFEEYYSSFPAPIVGVYTGEGIYGTLDNSGTISAMATATAGYEASAKYVAGIFDESDETIMGTLSNSGSITATATATAENNDDNAYARAGQVNGILSWGSIDNGELTNTASGVITATATARATTTDAESNSYASAHDVDGIYVSSITRDGSLLNQGSVNALASASGDEAHASQVRGVSVSNIFSGSLINQGTITATATATSTAPDGVASARDVYGLNIGYLDSSAMLINQGTISASANATGANTSRGAVYGVYVGGSNEGTLQNSGTITGALYLSGMNMTNSGSGVVNLPYYMDSNIGGGYEQTDSAQIYFGINGAGAEHPTAPGDYATLSVSGAFDISANPVLGVTLSAGASNLQAGDVIQNVVTAESLTGIAPVDGVYTGVTINGSPLIAFTATSDGFSDIDLEVGETQTIAGASSGGGSYTGSMQGVAGALDAIAKQLAESGDTTSDLAAILDYIYSQQTDAELAAALAGLLPALEGGTSAITAQSIRALANAVRSRMRGGNSGDMMFSDRNMWLKPFYSEADQDSNDDISGYGLDTTGIAFGVDGDVSDFWRVGIAASYADSDADSVTTKMDAETWQIGLYGDYTMSETTSLKLQGNYGWTDYDTKRNTGLGIATADYDSEHFRLVADYEMRQSEALTFKVFADYTHVDVDGYTETGSVAALSSDSDEAEQFILGVGAQYDHKLTDNSSLTFLGELGYDVIDEQSKLQSSFVGGGPAFVTKGLDSEPVVFRGGVGYNLMTKEDVEVTAAYDVELREDYDDQALSVNVRWRF